MAQYRNAALGATPQQCNTGIVQAKLKKVSARPANSVLSAVCYVMVWDRATTPTIGTHEPKLVIEVPAGVTDLQGLWHKAVCAGSRGWTLTAGLWVAASLSQFSSSAPVSGREPEVIVEYEPW